GRAMKMGAFGYVQKPAPATALKGALEEMKSFVTDGARNLLLVEDDDAKRKSLLELIGQDDINTTAVGCGREALAPLEERRYHCMDVVLGLPDMSGVELFQRVERRAEQT